MPMTLRFTFFCLLLSPATNIAFGQGACNCVYRSANARSTKCLPTLDTSDCKSVCRADVSPGIEIVSGTPARSCQEQPSPVLTPSTFQGLVIAIRYAIEHEGRPVYTGQSSNVLLTGQTLKAEVLQGQCGNGQAQGCKEITDAPLDTVEKATTEALQLCKGRRSEALESLGWVWGHERQSGNIQTAALAHNYQGIRNIHNQFQHDDRFKNLLSCFNGTEIQNMVDSFKTQPPALSPTTFIAHPHRDN